jgi:hypothetical protein
MGLQQLPMSTPNPRRKDMTIEERIGRNIHIDHNGCWIYGNNPHQYGTYEGVPVHRRVYEILVGPIYSDNHVHHKCEVPACCNPDHLIAVSPRQHKQIHTAHSTAQRYSQGTVPAALEADMELAMSPAEKRQRKIIDAVETLRRLAPDKLA